MKGLGCQNGYSLVNLSSSAVSRNGDLRKIETVIDKCSSLIGAQNWLEVET